MHGNMGEIAVQYNDILIRPWHENDSVTELTELLHRGYKALADAGMHFVASHQSDEVTRDRITKGTCFVAESNAKLVGTISLYDAKISEHFSKISDGYFGQYCVEPSLRASGLGSRLLSLVEDLARERGMKSLAFDTSELATDLIKYYERRGYEFVGHVRWPEVNYRSVTMLKHL
jgi:GNAT superfamily N-acetyltransferase